MSTATRKHSIVAGDRVRVYGAQGLVCNGDNCTVKFVHPTGWLDVQSYAGVIHLVHPKQCRRLKKRERRRVWVREDDMAVFHQGAMRSVDAMSFKPDDPCVEFVEVKRG